MLEERRHAVWLNDIQVGILHQRGDHTRFVFDPEYWELQSRPVLGLRFEEEPGVGVSSAMRLPAWFSNLLPESLLLRSWIAADRGVDPQREMELLLRIGHDLPGAVRVIEETTDPPSWLAFGRAGEVQTPPELINDGGSPLTKFSLAGVGLKFSLLRQGDRLTIPASGEGGDTIVKMPDPLYERVAINEYAMMTLASRVGIDVPEVSLKHRDELPPLPDAAWPNREMFAFAIQRFDRGAGRELIHIEDMAQVRGLYPHEKYRGNFETVAAMFYRGGLDTASLLEFVRRLTFCVLIGNGDAHLKNWSLIYRDRMRPQISPAYDLVATGYYNVGGAGQPEDLGLKLHGSRRFERVQAKDFERLAQRVGSDPGPVLDAVRETVENTLAAWPAVAEEALADFVQLRDHVAERLPRTARQLNV